MNEGTGIEQGVWRAMYNSQYLNQNRRPLPGVIANVDPDILHHYAVAQFLNHPVTGFDVWMCTVPDILHEMLTDFTREQMLNLTAEEVITWHQTHTHMTMVEHPDFAPLPTDEDILEAIRRFFLEHREE
jgi:hypothetical protein